MNTRLHRDVTLQVALALGFPRPAAEAIARANVEVDAGGYPRNDYHMRPVLLLGPDRRGRTAARHLAAAREALRAGDRETGWAGLGHGLHALQDQATHGPWWLLGIHWGPWFDDPDRTLCGRPDPHRRRLQAMEAVTRRYLEQVL